jgi:hypothetical protein
LLAERGCADRVGDGVLAVASLGDVQRFVFVADGV